MTIWPGRNPRSGRDAARTSRAEALTRLNTREELEVYQGRFKWAVVCFFVPFVALGIRLWQVQVAGHEQYQRKAENNLVRTVEIPADRGLVFDVNGDPIASNRPSYDVYITPRIFQKSPEAMPLLREFLNISPDEAERILQKMGASNGQAFLARKDITRDQVAMIESNRMSLPGVEVRTQSHRHYPFNEYASHTIGFMNEISSEELEELEPYGYRPGDYVGRTGIERAWEAILRGSPGIKRQVVDAHGIPQGEEEAEELLGHYRIVEPIPGRNLMLTLDMRLQEIIVDEFEGHESGAVVAVNPKDGSVLAMMSKPMFNPNSWTGRLSTEEKRRSDFDPFKPMIDKTTQSYFPGSTFKLVSALAALDQGFIREDETLHCPGFYEFGKRRFHCWNHAGHGTVDLTDSLKHSCDVYYYKLGEKLGMNTLAQYAYMFGFGERTGIGINNEQRGVVPTKDWHKKHSPEGFQHGFTLSTAVGQGDTRVTPLQLALSYGALANGGTLYYPRLVSHVEAAEGRTLFEYPARVRRRLEFPEDYLKQIGVGMAAVVNEPGGTSYKYRLDYVAVAGKTGTAQVRGMDSQQIDADGGVTLRHRDHAWFAAYAPVEDPTIALVVFVEHGGSGGKIAAPIAMRILDRYFREILGVDPEAQKALAQVEPRGPRRLNRPGARPDNNRVWRRPTEPSETQPAPTYLFSNINDSPDSPDRFRAPSGFQQLRLEPLPPEEDVEEE